MKPAKTLQKTPGGAELLPDRRAVWRRSLDTWRARPSSYEMVSRTIAALRHLVLPVGVETFGEKIVDGHVVARDLERQPFIAP